MKRWASKTRPTLQAWRDERWASKTRPTLQAQRLDLGLRQRLAQGLLQVAAGSDAVVFVVRLEHQPVLVNQHGLEPEQLGAEAVLDLPVARVDALVELLGQEGQRDRLRLAGVVRVDELALPALAATAVRQAGQLDLLEDVVL